VLLLLLLMAKAKNLQRFARWNFDPSGNVHGLYAAFADWGGKKGFLLSFMGAALPWPVLHSQGTNTKMIQI
jgi:hypothetical protein